MKILYVVEIEVEDKFKKCNEIVGDNNRVTEWNNLIDELEKTALFSPKKRVVGFYEEGKDELVGEEIVVYA